MAWSNKQKQIAARACKQAGIDDDARKFILRQFPSAVDDRGEPTSTAPKLDNADFERFMAIVEDRAGGRVLHFTPHYWSDKAASRSTVASERQAARIQALYHEFEQQAAGGLRGQGIYGFEGLVRRVSAQRTGRVEQLTPKEACNLIEMIGAMIKRRGPRQDKPAERQHRLFAETEPADAGPRYATVGHGEPDARRSPGTRTPIRDEEIPF